MLFVTACVSSLSSLSEIRDALASSFVAVGFTIIFDGAKVVIIAKLNLSTNSA